MSTNDMLNWNLRFLFIFAFLFNFAVALPSFHSLLRRRLQSSLPEYASVGTHTFRAGASDEHLDCDVGHSCFASGIKISHAASSHLFRSTEPVDGNTYLISATADRLAELLRKCEFCSVIGHIPHSSYIISSDERATVMATMFSAWVSDSSQSSWMPFPHHLAFKISSNLMSLGDEHVSLSVSSDIIPSESSSSIYSTSLIDGADVPHGISAHLVRPMSDPTQASQFALDLHSRYLLSHPDVHVRVASLDRIDIFVTAPVNANFSAMIVGLLSSVAEHPFVLHIQRRVAFQLRNRWARATSQRILFNPSVIAPTDNNTWQYWDSALDNVAPGVAADPNKIASLILPLRGRDEVVGIADSGLDLRSCYFNDPSYVVSHGGQLGPFFDLRHAVNSAARAPSADDMTHRKVIQYVWLGDTTDNTFGHGTHTSGSLAGQAQTDSTSALEHAQFNGMASDAKIAFFDIGNQNGDISMPIDLENDLFKWAYLAGARVHSDSWGGSVVDNSYTDESLRIDRFTFNNPDFLIVVAAGNDGTMGHGSVSAPATAKNILSIGASQSPNVGFQEGVCGPPAGDPVSVPYLPTYSSLCNNYRSQPERYNQQNVASFSAVGPTSDGRIKPDAVAHGEFTVSAKSSVSTGSLSQCGMETVNIVKILSGSSMAAPSAAGTVALIRQYYREGWFPMGTALPAHSILPSAALLKATYLHGARPLFGVRDLGCCLDSRSAYPLPDGDKAKCCCTNSACTSSFSAALGSKFESVAPSSGVPHVAQGFGRHHLPLALFFAANVTVAATSVPSFEVAHPSLVIPLGHQFIVGMVSAAAPRISNAADSTLSFASFGDPLLRATSELHEYGVCIGGSSISLNQDSSALQIDPPWVFRVTLVWTDPPAAIAALRSLVNDLDLSIVSNDTTPITWFGNGGSSFDRLNNVEQITLDEAAYSFSSNIESLFVVRVAAFNMPLPTQSYSLVASGRARLASKVNGQFVCNQQPTPTSAPTSSPTATPNPVTVAPTAQPTSPPTSSPTLPPSEPTPTPTPSQTPTQSPTEAPVVPTVPPPAAPQQWHFDGNSSAWSVGSTQVMSFSVIGLVMNYSFELVAMQTTHESLYIATEFTSSTLQSVLIPAACTVATSPFGAGVISHIECHISLSSTITPGSYQILVSVCVKDACVQGKSPAVLLQAIPTVTPTVAPNEERKFHVPWLFGSGIVVFVLIVVLCFACGSYLIYVCCFKSTTSTWDKVPNAEGDTASLVQTTSCCWRFVRWMQSLRGDSIADRHPHLFTDATELAPLPPTIVPDSEAETNAETRAVEDAVDSTESDALSTAPSSSEPADIAPEPIWKRWQTNNAQNKPVEYQTLGAQSVYHRASLGLSIDAQEDDFEYEVETESSEIITTDHEPQE